MSPWGGGRAGLGNRLPRPKSSRYEWHLLCLPRTTMALYFAPSLRTRNLQPWVGFGSSLSHSRLNASGPVAHPALGDQGEQSPAALRGRHPSRDPLGPQLHGVLEAQTARVHAGIAGGLRHEQSDHVIGQQMDPQLLLVHLRRLAAQHIHAGGGLEVAQVQLKVPATRVQRAEIVFADLPVIEQRGGAPTRVRQCLCHCAALSPRRAPRQWPGKSP